MRSIPPSPVPAARFPVLYASSSVPILLKINTFSDKKKTLFIGKTPLKASPFCAKKRRRHLMQTPTRRRAMKSRQSLLFMGVEYNTLCLGVPAEKTSSRDIVNEVRFSRKCSKNGLFIFGKLCNYIVRRPLKRYGVTKSKKIPSFPRLFCLKVHGIMMVKRRPIWR